MFKSGRSAPGWGLRAGWALALLSGLPLTAVAQNVAGAVVGLLRATSDKEGWGTANDFYFQRGKGRYQLAGADWQTDRVAVNNVQIAVGGGREPQTYYLNDVRQVVIGADSFVTVFDVQRWGQPQAAPTLVLGKRVWRRPQIELFTVHAFAGEVPLLRFPGQKAVALPLRQKLYEQAMLALVGDYPVLAAQLRTGQLNASHTLQILEAYLRWKPAGFDPTALLAQQSAAK